MKEAISLFSFFSSIIQPLFLFFMRHLFAFSVLRHYSRNAYSPLFIHPSVLGQLLGHHIENWLCMGVIPLFSKIVVQPSHTLSLGYHTLVWLEDRFIPTLGATYNMMRARLAAVNTVLGHASSCKELLTYSNLVEFGLAFEEEKMSSSILT